MLCFYVFDKDGRRLVALGKIDNLPKKNLTAKSRLSKKTMGSVQYGYRRKSAEIKMYKMYSEGLYGREERGGSVVNCSRRGKPLGENSRLRGVKLLELHQRTGKLLRGRKWLVAWVEEGGISRTLKGAWGDGSGRGK